MAWNARANAHVKVTLELAHAVVNKGRVFAFPGSKRA